MTIFLYSSIHCKSYGKYNTHVYKTINKFIKIYDVTSEISTS